MIKFKYNFKYFVFSLIIILGFVMLMDVKKSQEIVYFLRACLAVGMIFVLELATIWYSSQKKLKQYNIPIVNRYDQQKEYIYHLVLPIFLFINFVSFIYINPVEELSLLLLFFIFICFLILFINIRAYYEDKYKLETATHFIYYFAVIFSLFSLSNTLLNITNIYAIPHFITFLINCCITFVSFFFIFKDSVHFDWKVLIYSLIASIVFGVLIMYLFSSQGSILRTSFINSLLLYFATASWIHHDESDLDFLTVLEYITIIALALVLLYGIN